MIRWLSALLFIISSIPFIVIGSYIAIESDWHPTTVLDRSEKYRIEQAKKYVENYSLKNARAPTQEEFMSWSSIAPKELRLDGVGFTYTPSANNNPSTYTFRFWNGDAWIIWRPEYAASGVAEISPSSYFITNSKSTDLIIFFGPAILLLALAIFIIYKKPLKNAL